MQNTQFGSKNKIALNMRLGQKLEMPKRCKKPFYKNIRVVLWRKKPRKKKQIFKKSDDFENRPSSKGDRPCKMVSFGQKLKMPRTWEKPFYIRLVL